MNPIDAILDYLNRFCVWLENKPVAPRRRIVPPVINVELVPIAIPARIHEPPTLPLPKREELTVPDPAIFSDFRVAKRAAAVLANAIGCTLLQNAKGKPRVILGKQSPRDFPTWASCWSFLYQVRKDQIGVKS